MADRHDARTYAKAQAYYDGANGEAAVYVEDLDDAELKQIAALGALAPLVAAPNPTTLVRAADDALRAAGLSTKDIALSRRWQGDVVALERHVGAVQRLEALLDLQRISKALRGRDAAGIPLSWIVPFRRAREALTAADANFRARKRSGRRAPTYAL